MTRSPPEEKPQSKEQRIKQIQRLRANIRKNIQKRQAGEISKQEKQQQIQNANRKAQPISINQQQKQDKQVIQEYEHRKTTRATHPKRNQIIPVKNIVPRNSFQFQVNKTKIFSRGWIINSKLLIQDVLQRRYRLQGIKDIIVRQKVRTNFNQAIIQFQNEEFASLALKKANKIKSYMNLTDFSLFKKKIYNQKVQKIEGAHLSEKQQTNIIKNLLQNNHKQTQKNKCQSNQKKQIIDYPKSRNYGKAKSLISKNSIDGSPESKNSFKSERSLKRKKSPKSQVLRKLSKSAEINQVKTPEKKGKKIKKRLSGKSNSPSVNSEY